jgi:hypothetical protein
VLYGLADSSLGERITVGRQSVSSSVDLIHLTNEAYLEMAHTLESTIGSSMSSETTTVHYHSGGSMKLNACILILAHMVYL